MTAHNPLALPQRANCASHLYMGLCCPGPCSRPWPRWYCPSSPCCCCRPSGPATGGGPECTGTGPPTLWAWPPGPIGWGGGWGGTAPGGTPGGIITGAIPGPPICIWPTKWPPGPTPGPPPSRGGVATMIGPLTPGECDIMGGPGGWPGGIMGTCCMLPSAAMATMWGGIMPWGPMAMLRPGGWGGAWGPAGRGG